MVLPSPSRIFAAKVKEATHLHKDLFVTGDTIGGGSLSSALKAHLKQGLRVLMTENAAYTVRNNLEQVMSLGIEIVTANQEPKNFEGEQLKIEEVNLNKLADFLRELNEDLSEVDFVALAVQDHGTSPERMSNRQFRLQKMKEFMSNDPTLENLAFKEDEIPHYFLRMKASAKASRIQLPNAQVLLMDTAPAAILGCLMDPYVQKKNSALVINVGNGHTMAATISNGKVQGLMEHHTHLLTPYKIEQLLTNLMEGKLTDEKVFNDGGHGAYYLTSHSSIQKPDIIAATGPNRKILDETKLPVHFASPAGDMMMTGPVGLLEATAKKFRLRVSKKTSY
ncbi:DUF1786 domain-containing protein [Candidatus Bathyarchaeota archaeon]|nr:DUF1786 domain-containing protein [Candidatus Bathyarchaeota archaeon]